ncbi:hypothetical protein [Chromobacterium piscinae]|uniref:hypothetical protein n=1 Tax=Chromobacterium piscinae TaxID=686831 RepID=UPI003207B909
MYRATAVAFTTQQPSRYPIFGELFFSYSRAGRYGYFGFSRPRHKSIFSRLSLRSHANRLGRPAAWGFGCYRDHKPHSPKMAEHPARRRYASQFVLYTQASGDILFFWFLHSGADSAIHNFRRLKSHAIRLKVALLSAQQERGLNQVKCPDLSQTVEMSVSADAWDFGPSGADLIAALEVAYQDADKQMSVWALQVADQLLTRRHGHKPAFLLGYGQARETRCEWMRRLFVLETHYGVYAF